MVLLLKVQALRWALRWRLVGVMMVIGALGTACATMIVCYEVADSNGHLDGSGGLPAISTTGDKWPEHGVFAAGFSLVAVQVCLVMLLRAAQLETFFTNSSSCLVTLNMLVLAVGLAHAPALVAMAIIPDSASPVHFQAAIAALGILAVYGFLQALLSTLLHFTSGRSSWLRRAEVVWYLAWTVLSPIMIACWFVDREANAYEWLGVIFLFVYFLMFVVEFWLAPGDLRAADDDDERKTRRPAAINHREGYQSLLGR